MILLNIGRIWTFVNIIRYPKSPIKIWGQIQITRHCHAPLVMAELRFAMTASGTMPTVRFERALSPKMSDRV